MTIQIRHSVYRNVEGFLISGHRVNREGWPVKIFTTTRESAEVIRERVRAGLDVRLEDFKVGTNA